ncbi:hypothetical protein E1B28_013782 [Marasmius oreades]|uniref:AB hydrolase-1 domain-containing protein n=1 Tax=Marasmius oreades TaxID=181124 RepID=A0A9P7UQ85_9AGAR|nr:uncharacterized protein E1B28_013782 [Marasmius oreades]KAG7087844.1 hypothetical protein E1B28_013782 [Marasmius oreades]
MPTDHTYTLSNNIEIFFTDSGPPPGSNDYTTLVVLHGTCFNGYGLATLHDFAHPLNLRTVVWNRRNYPGSTRYTESELEDLNQGRKIFMDRIGGQVGEFLERFIENENIPKATGDRKAGGIAIMGWSMGTASALAIFSDSTLVSPESYSKLEPYVKDCVLYEPPHVSLGYSVPPGEKPYIPWQDPDQKTPEDIARNFGLYVSSYFDHNDANSADLRDMDTQSKMGSDPTITKWTAEELEKYINPELFVTVELPMFSEAMQSTLKELSDRAFYDERLVKTHFPKLKLTLIVATRTNWLCLWAPMKTQKDHDTHVAGGGAARPLKTYKIEGGNHFLHSEIPKTFLEKVHEGITRDD